MTRLRAALNFAIFIPAGRKREPGSESPGARWGFPPMDRWFPNPGSASGCPG